MFKMIQNPEFDATIKGAMPGDEADEFTFKARFVAMSSEERKAFDMATVDGTTAFLQKVFIGFSDVTDAADKPVPYSEQSRDWLIQQDWTRGPLLRTYFTAIVGAALGN